MLNIFFSIDKIALRLLQFLCGAERAESGECELVCDLE